MIIRTLSGILVNVNPLYIILFGEGNLEEKSQIAFVQYVKVKLLLKEKYL